MKRYAVVTHPKVTLSLSGNKIVGKQPVHELVQNYHWVRLDNEHIFMVANYSVSQHTALHVHDKVSMLPHISSSKKVLSSITNEKHKNVMVSALGLAAFHTMEDLIDIVISKHGAVFAPTI